MSRYILGIDEGTTSVRVALFDIDKNEIVQKQQQELTMFYPHDGWVEQDGNQIFDVLKNLIKVTIEIKNINPKEILAMSITNQRETTVAWDKTTGQCVCPVINWQCRRTSKFFNQLSDEDKKYLKSTTGLIPDAYFSASKIKWDMDNVDQVKKLKEQNNIAFGTIESYLIFRLTNGKSFVTDATNASRTMLMNLYTCDWDERCLNIFGIDKNLLGKIVCNDEIVGYYDFEGTAIPICGVVGDQQSSLFGQACFEEGMVKNTYGTGCFMVMNTGHNIVQNDKLISTVGYKLKNESPVYALEGSVFNAGSCIELIQSWGLVQTPQQTQEMALSVKDSGKIVFVPALTGLGAPYWDMNARGMFIGITRATQKEHMVRAVLESIAFCCLDVLLQMQKGVTQIKEIRCDGGMSKNQFLMQFQSDITNTPIVISNEFEKTLMGSVYLALCGLKITDKFAVAKKYQTKQIFLPQMDKETLVRKYTRWRRAVVRSLEWVK